MRRFALYIPFPKRSVVRVVKKNRIRKDAFCLVFARVRAGQVVIDAVDARSLIAEANSIAFDFEHMKEHELYNISMPLNFKTTRAAPVDGLVAWYGLAPLHRVLTTCAATR
jgi:hypothetical protein